MQASNIAGAQLVFSLLYTTSSPNGHPELRGMFVNLIFSIMLQCMCVCVCRSAMVAFVNSGIYLGDVLGMSVSGVLCAREASEGPIRFGGWCDSSSFKPRCA
jgi:hypothetical protein